MDVNFEYLLNITLYSIIEVLVILKINFKWALDGTKII